MMAVAHNPAPLADMALLRLLHLVSPALPIGTFAWSQGLEYAIDSGALNSPEQIRDWLAGVMQHNLTHLDLPLLARLYRAAQAKDTACLSDWNDWILASRETRELYEEDIQLGRALYRLLISLEMPARLPRDQPVSVLCAFAEAAVQGQIPLQATLLGWLWSWLENQITVACKVLPLGQTAAQKVLMALMPGMPACVERALTLNDDQLGSAFPGYTIISAQHETQYSRLFRS